MRNLILLMLLCSVPAISHSQTTWSADCSDWDRSSFWRLASLGDVQFCYDNLANPFAETRDRFTPIHKAAGHARDPDILAFLLAKDEAVGFIDAQDHNGETALHRAVAWRDFAAAPIVDLLISAGADPALLNKNDVSALHFAAGSHAISGQRKVDAPQTVARLISAGAALNARTTSRQTPLHWAVSEDAEPQVTALLLAAGAAVNAQDDWDSTPLHYAVSSLHTPADQQEIVAALIARGADVNLQDAAGETSLHLAARGNTNPAIFTLLLDAGARVTIVDRHGTSPYDYVEENEALFGTAVLDRMAALAASEQ